MANEEHVEVFKKGPRDVQEYMSAMGLRKLDLSNSRFNDLHHRRGYVLVGSNLSGAEFVDCQLQLFVANADLRDCFFGEGIKLMNVQNADLAGARLQNVDLRLASGLSQSQVDSIASAINTSLNAYLQVPTFWQSSEQEVDGDENSPRHTESANDLLTPRGAERKAASEASPGEIDVRRVAGLTEPILLAGSTLMDALFSYEEVLRTNNSLSLDQKEGALEFVVSFRESVEALLFSLEGLPGQTRKELSEEKVSRIALAFS